MIKDPDHFEMEWHIVAADLFRAVFAQFRRRLGRRRHQCLGGRRRIKHDHEMERSLVE